MKAYQALAGIPYIGPALGAAAAGTVIAAGGAYAANVAGIAHGGLDNVPAERTYLLDKGERVVSPAQNRDLTSFLSRQNRPNGGVVPQVVINAAPGVESSVRRENGNVIVEQRLRALVRDEISMQSSPGGMLDRGFAI